MVCRWMAEVTRVRRPKPQNDPTHWLPGRSAPIRTIVQTLCRQLVEVECHLSCTLHFALGQVRPQWMGRCQCWFCSGGGRNASGRYSIVRVAKLVTGLSPCWSKPGLSCLVRIFIGDCFQPMELADQCSNLELSQRLSRAWQSGEPLTLILDVQNFGSVFLRSNFWYQCNLRCY